jgi:hypothetical protein
MAVSGRTLAILGRFPRHLDLARADKLAAELVQGLASGLEVQTAQVGRIRRAHRLGHADELADLLLLAGLHEIRVAELAAALRRLDAIRAGAAAIAAATGPAIAAARTALAGLIGSGQATFAAWPGEPDDRAATARLVAAAGAAASYAAHCDRVRTRIETAIAIHRTGNGTVEALLRGAASAIDLDVVGVRHSADGFWHLADCADRIRLVRPEPPDGKRSVVVPPPIDLIALEENPYAPHDIDPFAVQHARLFTITRPGFASVPVTIQVVGVADRTMFPMVVNRDAGIGVAFHGSVPGGAELTFDRAGAATLGATDVTGQTWAFRGAVFAQDGEASDLDFAFTADAGTVPHGQAAQFVVGVPYAAAFDPTATWPQSAGVRPAPPLAVGATRWAFFVREGHFGTTDDTGATPLPAVAYFAAGVADESVFVGAPLPDAAKLGFAWEEREPYAVRILIPERLAVLDDPADPPAAPHVTEMVRTAVERFRAAGIRLTVEYTSELWTLGEGVLRDIDSAEPEGIVVDGTRLWPTPPLPPSP